MPSLLSTFRQQQKKKKWHWPAAFKTIFKSKKVGSIGRITKAKTHDNPIRLSANWRRDMNEDEDEELRRLRDAMQQAEVFEQTEELDRMRQPLSSQLLKFTNALQGWQQRTCVLDPENGELRYYLKNDTKSAKPRGVLSLAHAEIFPREEDSLAFSIVHRGCDLYRFKAPNTKLKQEWVNRLRTVADDHAARVANRSTIESARMKRPDCPESICRGTGKLPAVVDTLNKTLRVAAQQQLMVAHDIDEVPPSLRGNDDLYQALLAIKSYSGSLLEGLNECKNLIAQIERHTLFSGRAEVVDHAEPAVQSESVVEPANHADEETTCDDEDDFDTADQSTLEKPVFERRQRADEAALLESENGVVLSLLSRLKLGTDLTKIGLPVFIMYPCSFLESCSDFFANASLFLAIGQCDGGQDRLAAVVKWYLSSFWAGCKGGAAQKPYNPVVGELFRCAWRPSDQVEAVQFFAEQVGHHPPTTCFYVSASDNSVVLNGSVRIKCKFMGTSASMPINGESRLFVKLANDEREVFVLQYPAYHARSILTSPWMELGGKVQIASTTSANVAVVTFETKSFYGNKSHCVTAELKNASGAIYCRVSGDWKDNIDFDYSTGQQESIQPAMTATAIRHIRPLEKQHPMESRRVWHDVTQALVDGEYETAQKCKERVELAQRTREYEGSRYFLNSGKDLFVYADMPTDCHV